MRHRFRPGSSRRRFRWTFLFVALFVLLPTVARADTPPPPAGTMRICLKLDTSAMVDKAYGDLAKGNTYKARGIYAKLHQGPYTRWGWDYADVDDGCFLTLAAAGWYTISVMPISDSLGGSNFVRVFNANYQQPVVTTYLYLAGQSGATYNVTLTEDELLRIYGVLTYAIHERFRGQYSGEVLRAFYQAKIGSGTGGLNLCTEGGCSDSTESCFCAGDWGGPALAIGNGAGGYDHSELKSVITHEFGHANHYYGAADFWNGDNYMSCGLSLDENGGHRLRGREYANCAAVEGWAHFVAGDIFNNHSGSGSSDPHAELFYLDGAGWDLGYGGSNPQNDCPEDVPLDPSTTYPGKNYRPFYPGCFNGYFPTIGVEMDWARLFWDYHTDTDKLGNPRGHSQLHDDLAATGNWSSVSSAYSDILGSLGSTEQTRFTDAAEYNGVCVSGSC